MAEDWSMWANRGRGQGVACLPGSILYTEREEEEKKGIDILDTQLGIKSRSGKYLQIL